MVSYNEHNRASRIPEVLSALQTADVALVSDAGTPAVSDPGSELVAAVVDAGGRVVPVPGPSALTASMAVGLHGKDGVLFLGFLPRRKGERRRLLDSVATLPYSIVVFEAPHRLRAALQGVLEALGDRKVTACRELTKVHEEVFRGTASQALEHFDSPRGEFTIIIEGARTPEPGPDLSWAFRRAGPVEGGGGKGQGRGGCRGRRNGQAQDGSVQAVGRRAPPAALRLQAQTVDCDRAADRERGALTVSKQGTYSTVRPNGAGVPERHSMPNVDRALVSRGVGVTGGQSWR